MTISDDELSETDDAVCPKCGIAYADDELEDNIWVGCDGCLICSVQVYQIKMK